MKIDTDEIRNVDCIKIWKSFRREETPPDGSDILLEADISILVSKTLALCDAYDAKCAEVEKLRESLEETKSTSTECLHDWDTSALLLSDPPKFK